jgi:hypothetical protein
LDSLFIGFSFYYYRNVLKISTFSENNVINVELAQVGTTVAWQSDCTVVGLGFRAPKQKTNNNYFSFLFSFSTWVSSLNSTNQPTKHKPNTIFIGIYLVISK